MYKKKRKKQRKWVKEWISTHGQQGLAVLQSWRGGKHVYPHFSVNDERHHHLLSTHVRYTQVARAGQPWIVGTQ